MRRFSTSTKLRSSTFFAVDFYNQKVVAKGKVVADVFDLELHKAMQHDISRKNFTKLLGFQGDERLESLLGPIFGHYSQLKFDELPLGFEEKQKLFDPEYLPTRQEFLTMFRLEFDGEAYNSGRLPKIEDLLLSTKRTVYRDLIRFVCHLRDGNAKRYPYPTALTHYCRMIQSTAQPLTQDFVNELARALAARIEERGYSKSVPIVEVGAGSGRLTHFLNATKLIPVPVIATDVAQGVWEFDPTAGPIPSLTVHPPWKKKQDAPCTQSKNAVGTRTVDSRSPFPLQLLGVREAVAELKPEIVIASWMPNTQNWPIELALSEASRCVREFIHIGELGECVDRKRFARFWVGRSQLWDRVSRMNLSTSDQNDDWGYSIVADITEQHRTLSLLTDARDSDDDVDY